MFLLICNEKIRQNWLNIICFQSKIISRFLGYRTGIFCCKRFESWAIIRKCTIIAGLRCQCIRSFVLLLFSCGCILWLFRDGLILWLLFRDGLILWLLFRDGLVLWSGWFWICSFYIWGTFSFRCLLAWVIFSSADSEVEFLLCYCKIFGDM